MSPLRVVARPKVGFVAVSLVLSALTATGSVVGGSVVAPVADRAPTVSTKVDLAATSKAGRVLWSGNFERGGVPHGANGRSCGTGKADGGDSRVDQYRSIEEMGNTACTNRVSFSRERTRTPDSRRALKVVMGARQQRELAKWNRLAPQRPGKRQPVVRLLDLLQLGLEPDGRPAPRDLGQ